VPVEREPGKLAVDVERRVAQVRERGGAGHISLGGPFFLLLYNG
jgi:hypothetical protein